MENLIKLKTLNCHITCKICRGYLVDATTVIECIHTFCKSCLMKHLEENNTCPTCQIVIHQSRPLEYIRFDRTMQEIVFKLVPGLQLDEIKRERELYRTKGLPYPKEVPAGTEVGENNTAQDQAAADSDNPRMDEQINVELECVASHFKSFKKKFLRVSSQTTIKHLKKFIKRFDGLETYRNIDILYNNKLLGNNHTLRFAYVTKFRRFRELTIKLQYRSK